MPELSAPLRLTWDLPADGELAVRCWSEIAAARVLFVEMRVSGDTVPTLQALVEPLGLAPGPRLTVLADGPTASKAAGYLPAALAEKTQLQLLPPYPRGDECNRLAARFQSLTWCLWSTREGLRSFDAALQRTREDGQGLVAVLNPAQPALPLDEEDRTEAKRAWRRYETGKTQLRVHDLFLDEELGREPFGGYAGCQAGRTLAHLTADGEVVACRTLPVLIGDLRRDGLTEIWAGPERRRFVQGMDRLPRECIGCSVAETCGGGCRGLNPTGGRDPSCTRVRSA